MLEVTCNFGRLERIWSVVSLVELIGLGFLGSLDWVVDGGCLDAREGIDRKKEWGICLR